jgi:hypothetical protein
MDADGGEDDDGNMAIDDEMMHSANTIRVVDMSESVFIQVPMEIVVLLHENNDAGLRYFQVGSSICCLINGPGIRLTHFLPRTCRAHI